MSDAIARELALKAYQAAPVGATIVELVQSDDTIAHVVTTGEQRITVSYAGQDDDGVHLFEVSMETRDPDFGWLSDEPDPFVGSAQETSEQLRWLSTNPQQAVTLWMSDDSTSN